MSVAADPLEIKLNHEVGAACSRLFGGNRRALRPVVNHLAARLRRHD